jgi:hypothetical protein
MRFDLWQFFETTQGTIIVGAFIGVVSISIGALISRSLLKTATRQPQRADRTQDTRMLAMRCVLALDDLVGSCHSAAIDAPEFNPSDSGDFILHTDDPRLLLPKDADWTLLKPELSEEILWMPNRLRNVLDGLESLDVNAPEFDDFFLHRQADFSKIGLRALDIIDRLCAEYGIQAPERPMYFDPRATFEEGLKLAVDFNDRRRKSQRNASTGRSNVTPLFGNGGLENKPAKPSDKDPVV